ncbi:alkaline phosphatase family protein [Methylocaldum sp.]|uniref:alkaline phosphatase family protein n=1 Tax=Methylocaldum sp. TaxID=1969727 RepID=UPI002D4DBCC3|nr:alkaline phosphatase family protein [Methylocaldum sp.]HYE38270.1 alkaline phosphatase family protein [Methylocaldum sp.]
MLLPDYQGTSIVNLLSSLITGLGGEPNGYAPLDSLPAAEVSAYRNVVLVVVDGLGYEFLARRGQGSLLRQHLRSRMTSVFPSTTATAITSFLTGLAPQQHGLTGWHMYFKELGTVLAVLPGTPRYGGTPVGKCGIEMERLLGHVPMFNRIPLPSYIVSPRRIAHSDFNLAHQGRAELRAFDTLEQFFTVIAQTLRKDKRRKFIYAYWPELDHIGHENGLDSPEAEQHLTELDGALGVFLESIPGTDTLLVIAADHGQIDSSATRVIELDDHPDLSECLILPLCGERRAAYCYVKSGDAHRFERYVQDNLTPYLELHPSRDLLASGCFGLGAPHPRLAERIGDYALIMKENYVIKDWLPGERRYRQIGVHGGTSPEEMFVPLIVAAA